MRFNCPEPVPASEWQPFFCIIPRRVGPNDCRWLEIIERRLEESEEWLDWYRYHYRAKGDSGDGVAGEKTYYDVL